MPDKKTDVEKIADDIWFARDMFRKVYDVRENGSYASLSAYVAYKMLEEGFEVTEPLKDFQAFVREHIGNDALKDYLLNSLGEFWSRISNIFRSNGYGAEALKDFVLEYDFTERAGRAGGDFSTPDSIRWLTLAILDPQDGDKVADLACGCGGFLSDVVEAQPGVSVYGIDIRPDIACLTMAKLDLLGANGTTEIGDALSTPHPKAFDKIFVNYPFGMRVASMRGEGEYYDAIRSGKTPLGRPASADWVFNKLAIDSLSDGGTAVCVMTNGAAFNGGDRQARKYFIENGLVKAVIALPRNLFHSTSIPSTLIVLGRNEGPVRMVDASDLSQAGRRWDSLDDEDIAEIVRLLHANDENSRVVERDKIVQADYALYPSRYVGRSIELENATKLGDLALSIERGATIRANELDELTIEGESRISYLRLSDIEDGSIGSDLPRLRQLDSSTERQWLKTGDLIISKNGAPFKVAVVADIAENQIILANGNLYIVRLDTDRVDPYFVAAYLANEDGKAALERMVVGTAIPNLPQRNLKEIEVPVPPMEKQREIAERYQASLDEIEVLKIRINKARVAAASAYDERMGN